MDAGVGRVLETPESAGIDENTIQLFTSDNGPALAERPMGSLARYNGLFRGAKGDSLEGGIRVPALLRWPAGIAAGMRIDEMAHFGDWYPTLRSLAGLSCQSDVALDGWDVSRTFRGEATAGPGMRFWQRNRYEPVAFSNAAVRDGAECKLPDDQDDYLHRIFPIEPTLPSRHIGSVPPPPLYNLSEDPWEQTDRAESSPEQVQRLTSEWSRWFASVYADWRDARAR
jgi:arylsulfatase A-like enzyme